MEILLSKKINFKGFLYTKKDYHALNSVFEEKKSTLVLEDHYKQKTVYLVLEIYEKENFAVDIKTKLNIVYSPSQLVKKKLAVGFTASKMVCPFMQFNSDLIEKLEKFEGLAKIYDNKQRGILPKMERSFIDLNKRNLLSSEVSKPKSLENNNRVFKKLMVNQIRKDKIHKKTRNELMVNYQLGQLRKPLRELRKGVDMLYDSQKWVVRVFIIFRFFEICQKKIQEQKVLMSRWEGRIAGMAQDEEFYKYKSALKL